MTQRAAVASQVSHPVEAVVAQSPQLHVESVAVRPPCDDNEAVAVVLPAANATELAERVNGRLRDEIREYVEANPNGSKVFDIARGLQVERDKVLGVIAGIKGIKQNKMGFWFPVDGAA